MRRQHLRVVTRVAIRAISLAIRATPASGAPPTSRSVPAPSQGHPERQRRPFTATASACVL